MSARRALLRIPLRSANASCVRSASSKTTRLCTQSSRYAAVARPLQQRGLCPYVQQRWHSKPVGEDAKVYDFKKIVEILEEPTQGAILIDVREPHEYTQGYIPSALNLPITSQPDALFLDPEDFQDKFGFQKPPPTKPLVFYCRSGVRSSAAANMAKQVGYSDVAEYRGSWNDWVAQGGQESKNPQAGKPGAGGEMLGSN